MSASSPVPSFSARSNPADFLQGLALIGRATGLIFRTPRLLALSLLCGLVTLVALGGLFALLWVYAPDLLGMVWTRPEPWWGRVLWGLVFVLLFLVLFVVGASVVVPLVLAPLQDPLSELTEERCGHYSSPPFRLGAFFRGLVLGVSHTLARIFFLLLGLAVLLPLHLVPGVGSIAWAVLGTIWTMLWLAGEHLAAPMTRHQYPFDQVRRVLRQRWPLCLGFGAGVYVLLWVPLLNNFFLPVAVVGGTLLYRGLLAVGNVPPPPDGK
ncbi:Sulfate transporter, CysZ-type [Cystobacter fuscus DSM 2262]|uniref:Sulfate transporter, CysZ-type n=1 Tax=Cystobacter fuscus (strain ATCC 25194 / DSM 2262 / NBRC 100088 / M29) TaxID=1242864 RepID=S9QQB8_CYSF2|nr:EI24 domain-containing protein [Cystobacter fuscus]EPX58798.1 Sulfate transporter, CysZ-type [Cystobacter fuscus DSM 2262]